MSNGVVAAPTLRRELVQQEVFKFLGVKSPQKTYAAPEFLRDFASYDESIPPNLTQYLESFHNRPQL